MKKLYIALISIVVFVLLFFLVSPLVLSYERLFVVRKFNTLVDAKNYYTILAQIVGIVATTLGVALGYVYYSSRLSFDDRIFLQKRKRKHLDCLLEELKNFDRFVDEIICFQVHSEEELRLIRNKILRSFENIVIMLEENSLLLEFSDEEINTILKVNSFVEKNQLLMFQPFDSLKEESFILIKDVYINLIQDARRTCYKKIS